VSSARLPRYLLQDHLRPQVDRREFLPTVVDLVRIELEVDIEKLEQVEQNKWDSAYAPA